MAGHEGKSHPDCINSSNPCHECSEYCYGKIAEAKAKLEEHISLNNKPPAERTVHPDCINASNPYHECTDYCFKRIADAQDRIDTDAAGVKTGDAGPSSHEPDDTEAPSQHRQDDDAEEGKTTKADAGTEDLNKDAQSGYPQMTEKQQKLFELRLKMNEARKANQIAMVAEKKRAAPVESRGISKQKWLDDRKKKIGKLLDSNGLDMKKAYMLDTQEMAETKYKKWEKDPAPHGWDVFNQKTLYNAYKKRTKDLEVDMEAYNKAKEADPEFYREASSLQYGKVSKVPEENIDKMVKELQDRESKRQAFSRRRKFHEEKDIDSINDRNEHFNKKIERAFGKYTLEIKNNLERGTALPD
ncbi:GCIP-interacting family protein [Carex rostrata]